MYIRALLVLLALSLSLPVHAQGYSDSAAAQDSIEYYYNLSPAEREKAAAAKAERARAKAEDAARRAQKKAERRNVPVKQSPIKQPAGDPTHYVPPANDVDPRVPPYDPSKIKQIRDQPVKQPPIKGPNLVPPSPIPGNGNATIPAPSKLVVKQGDQVGIAPIKGPANDVDPRLPIKGPNLVPPSNPPIKNPNDQVGIAPVKGPNKVPPSYPHYNDPTHGNPAGGYTGVVAPPNSNVNEKEKLGYGGLIPGTAVDPAPNPGGPNKVPPSKMPGLDILKQLAEKRAKDRNNDGVPDDLKNPTKVSPRTQKALNQPRKRIQGMLPAEYAAKEKVDRIMTNVKDPRVSKDRRAQTATTAVKELTRLADGFRYKRAVPDSIYQKMGMGPNYIAEEREGSERALARLNAALKELTK